MLTISPVYFLVRYFNMQIYLADTNTDISVLATWISVLDKCQLKCSIWTKIFSNIGHLPSISLKEISIFDCKYIVISKNIKLENVSGSVDPYWSNLLVQWQGLMNNDWTNNLCPVTDIFWDKVRGKPNAKIWHICTQNRLWNSSISIQNYVEICHLAWLKMILDDLRSSANDLKICNVKMILNCLNNFKCSHHVVLYICRNWDCALFCIN